MGETQAGKMIGAGAFGQKSAVRQSSLDAYRKAFAELRSDLDAALRDPPALAAGGTGDADPSPPEAATPPP